jgi:uncharacterized protein (UPF0305 family)
MKNQEPGTFVWTDAEETQQRYWRDQCRRRYAGQLMVTMVNRCVELRPDKYVKFADAAAEMATVLVNAIDRIEDLEDANDGD